MKNEGASSPVERALWFVENRLEGEISLRSIAESVCVTAPEVILRKALFEAASRGEIGI